MNLPDQISAYLMSRAAAGPWELAGDGVTGFAGAAVIPALAESARLPATLLSLAAASPELLACWLVVVVMNHRPDTPDADRSGQRGHPPAGDPERRNVTDLLLKLSG